MKVVEVDVPEDRIGYFVDNRNLAYALYRPDFSRKVVYCRTPTANELLSQLDREGVTYLYAASTSLAHAAVLNEAQQRGQLIKVGSRMFTRVSGEHRPRR